MMGIRMCKKKNIFSDETSCFLKNTLTVFISNAISLFSGMFVSLGLPKVLPMEDYSDYKLFMLYLSYIGLFHFGLIDGAVIKLAGKSKCETGLLKYRFVTRFLAGMETAAALMILAAVFILADGEYRFIGSAAAADILIHNMLAYYRSMLQISMRYLAYTVTGVYGSLYRLFSLLILFYISKSGMAVCQVYILFYLAGEISELFICIWLCRNITFGRRAVFREVTYDIRDIFRQGTPMLFAGIAATLILNMDRQFVSVLFSKKDYAVYSFSYSLMNMILTLISAMSVVLYPAMKEKKISQLAGYYDRFSYVLSFLVSGSFLFLPVLNGFILWFLPDYAQALDILRVILPAAAFLALMQIVIISFYKVIEITGTYLAVSASVLGISFLLNFTGYMIFKNMEAIAVATVLSCYIWLFISDRIIKKKISSSGSAVTYLFWLTVSYYFSYFYVWEKNPYAGTASYAVLLFLFSRKIQIKRFLKR